MSRADDDDRDSWDQLDDESDEAYEAWTTYRDMPRGERKVVRVAEALGKSRALIYRWSGRYGWSSRIMAWDRKEERVRLEKHWEEIEKMSARHAGQAAATAQVMFAPVAAIMRLLRDRPDVFYEYFMMEDGVVDFDRLERVLQMVYTTSRFLPSVVQMEREARGLSTPAVGGNVDVPPPEPDRRSLPSDADIQKIQDLFAAVNGREMPRLPAHVTGTNDD